MFIKLKYLGQLYPKLSNSIKNIDLIPFIPMESLKKGFHYCSQISISTKEGYHVFQNGDLLLAKVTPCFENGNLAIAKISEPFGYCANAIFVFRCNSKVNPLYLFYCFQNPFLKTYWKT